MYYMNKHKQCHRELDHKSLLGEGREGAGGRSECPYILSFHNFARLVCHCQGFMHYHNASSHFMESFCHSSLFFILCLPRH